MLVRSASLLLLLGLAMSEAVSAYPVFGTKRYGRSSSGALPHRVATWGIPAPMPHYAVAPTYYAATAQDYPDGGDYYYAAAAAPPQETTYSYLPPVYHQPYYYGYGYYDPVDDLQEEIHQEEEREEALPIGQETWYEGQRDAFLQNLIISQLYNDGRILRHPYESGPADYDSVDDDEDVKELKSLVKKTRVVDPARFYEQRPEYYEHVWFPTENGPWFENSWAQNKRNKKQESGEYGPKGTINFTDRKVKPTQVPTTPAPTSTRAPDFDARRGQKEIALLRPPTPARNPTRSRSAAGVYDTIKQLLSMEQGLRKEGEDHSRRPQKRFVSNEETLVEELSGLKKVAA